MISIVSVSLTLINLRFKCLELKINCLEISFYYVYGTELSRWRVKIML